MRLASGHVLTCCETGALGWARSERGWDRYTACERLPSLHISLLLCSCCAVFPGSCSALLLFPGRVREGSWDAGYSRRPPRGRVVDESWRPPSPLAASACAADLRPSNGCAVDLMPQPAFWDSQGTLLAPFGTSFLSLLGTCLVTFGGVGFETRFLHQFGDPKVVQHRCFSGCRSA